jgi:putative ABC transport system permease protein
MKKNLAGVAGLVVRNARRSPIRGAMTVIAVAISLVAFLLIRTVSAGWTEQVKETPDNRVIVRHKMGWLGTLPVHYVQRVREFAGVRRAMGASWGNLQLPTDKLIDLGSVAVDAQQFIDMHYELVAPADQKRAFLEDRRAAFVSEELASELGWKLGDIVHFRGTSFPGEMELKIAAIFRSTRKGFARRALYLHWAYYNEVLPEPEQDRINIIATEVEDPHQGARIAQQIDIAFDGGDNQTFSQEDQAVNAQLIGEFGAILDALDFVSVLILGIVLLVLGNTLAMTVRERRKEYGTLRALGFVRKHVLTFVIGESALLGFVGGVLGLLLSYPLVAKAASRFLEESIGLPPLEISLQSALFTVISGVAIGALAGFVPAHQMTKVQIVDALRRVG